MYILVEIRYMLPTNFSSIQVLAIYAQSSEISLTNPQMLLSQFITSKSSSLNVEAAPQ